MSLLAGLRVVQLGDGLAAAVCGRLFADVGATVVCIDPAGSTPLAQYLYHGKTVVAENDRWPAVAAADLIVCEGRPRDLRARQHDADSLRRRNSRAALVLISPFGQTGPMADDPATDLTLLYCERHRPAADRTGGRSGRGADPPGRRAIGLHRWARRGLRRYARGAWRWGRARSSTYRSRRRWRHWRSPSWRNAGLHGRSRSRQRLTDGNGATVAILPARDGYVAISPREERQWAAGSG